MMIQSTIIIKKARSGRHNVLRFYGTGRRKEAIAKCWLSPGFGKITVNSKDVEHYFARPALRMIINQPFTSTATLGKFDVICNVIGGGLSGQAGAIRHGISRALDKADPNLHNILRSGDFLTRDSREVERKMYGHKKSRKSFQFSKR